MMNRASVQRRHPSRLVSWVFRGSYQRHFHGLPVAVSPQDPATLEAVFDKMREAADFVHRFDRRAFCELLTVTGGVFVFGTTGGTPAEWWRNERLVVVQYEYASDAATTSQALALVLVHEAMHIWLERQGFEYSAERRARLEKICHRRELRLARHLPDSEHLVSWLTAEPTLEEHHFSDQAFRQRAHAELQRLGIPSWLVRQLEFWSKCVYRLTSAWSRPA